MKENKSETMALLRRRRSASSRGLLSYHRYEDDGIWIRNISAIMCSVYIGCLLLSVFLFSFLFEELTVVDSLYFGVVTLTTVGYGDITPSTVPGQLCAGVLSAAGAGIALGILNVSIENHYSKQAWWDRALSYSAATLAVSTVAIARWEGWDPPRALYFCLATGTTLGYGDVEPRTAQARVFCVAYVPLLVVTFGLFVTDRLTDAFGRQLDKDGKIERWLDRCILTMEGFDTLDVDEDRRIEYPEFLVGMMKRCSDQYVKIPDQFLVEKIGEKFRELDVSGTGFISLSDCLRYAKGERGGQGWSHQRDAFSEEVLIRDYYNHLRGKPMKDVLAHLEEQWQLEQYNNVSGGESG